MSDIAVTTQPAEVKPSEEAHVPHENGTAAVAVPEAHVAPLAPVHVTPDTQAAVHDSVVSDLPKEAPQATEDVDLDIDVESKPDMRKDQASEVRIASAN